MQIFPGPKSSIRQEPSVYYRDGARAENLGGQVVMWRAGMSLVIKFESDDALNNGD